MPTGLYLDSARFGLMQLRARRTHHEFIRLTAREGTSCAVVDLVCGGFDSWPRKFRRGFPDLNDWRGIEPFRQSLRTLTGAPAAAEVFLSTHSAPLMVLGAHLLCRMCPVILHTDLEWPPYLEILRDEARRRNRKLVSVPVRDAVFGDRAGSDEVFARLIGEYRQAGAEGLFLTEVTHDGLRLPLGRLVASLASVGVPRFVVIDAAQALGHTPLDLQSGPGDLYLGGCHKWVGSGLPLSLAISPRGQTRDLVSDFATRLIASRRLDDPLLRFTKTLATGKLDAGGETVNLAPLFPASAAVSEHLDRVGSAARRFRQRLENVMALSAVAGESGWGPFAPHPEHRSGILLLRARPDEVRLEDANRIRALFRREGVTLSAYSGGVIRTSLPDAAWSNARFGAAGAALLHVRDELIRRPGSRAGWSKGPNPSPEGWY